MQCLVICAFFGPEWRKLRVHFGVHMPESTAVIRSAADSDGEFIATLIAEVFTEYPGCVFDWSEFPELQAPASHFADQEGALWLAEREGTVVGCIAIAPTDETNTCELFKVYVARSERGSGLARRLLDTALDFATARGAERIVLWSDTRFHAGHRFYEKNGFVRLPGQRFVPDLSNTQEYFFTRDLVEAPHG